MEILYLSQRLVYKWILLIRLLWLHWSNKAIGVMIRIAEDYIRLQVQGLWPLGES